MKNYPYLDIKYKILADGNSVEISQEDKGFIIITKDNLSIILNRCTKHSKG